MKSKIHEFLISKKHCKSVHQLIFVFILFFGVSAIAQTKEISVGSGVLFNGYTGNVMYRKYKPDFKSALRVQLSTFDLGIESSKPFQTNLYNIGAVSNNLKTNKSYSFGIGLDIGKQKNINTIEKFQFYRGFDVGVSVAINNFKSTENIYTNPKNDTVRVYRASRRESQENNLSINYSQFLGVRYQIMPNLSLSLEPSLSLFLSRNSFISKTKRYSITDQTIEEAQFAETYEPTVKYRMNLNPSAILWISYRFIGKKK